MNQRTQEALKRIMHKLAADSNVGAMPQPPPQEAAQHMPPAPEELPPEVMQQLAQQGGADVEQLPPEAQEAGDVPAEGAEGPDQLIQALRAAYCAEKVSEYQYENAINVCLGKSRNYFLSECTEHRQEEHDHADLLAERIETLGGTIPFTLEEVAALNPAGSPEEVENNRDTAVLTAQIVEAEQAAVRLYSTIEEMTRDTDPVTNDMIIGILATEQKHVVDMMKVEDTIQM